MRICILKFGFDLYAYLFLYIQYTYIYCIYILYILIYIYIYMHICIYVCVYTQMHVCMDHHKSSRFGPSLHACGCISLLPTVLPSSSYHQASTSRKVGVWLAWGLTGGNHRRTNEGSDLCRAGAKQGEALAALLQGDHCHFGLLL